MLNMFKALKGADRPRRFAVEVEMFNGSVVKKHTTDEFHTLEGANAFARGIVQGCVMSGFRGRLRMSLHGQEWSFNLWMMGPALDVADLLFPGNFRGWIAADYPKWTKRENDPRVPMVEALVKEFPL